MPSANAIDPALSNGLRRLLCAMRHTVTTLDTLTLLNLPTIGDCLALIMTLLTLIAIVPLPA
jgi:hypothetical protein